MHPLLHLIATRPALLAEHAEAYAVLISAELPRISAAWQRSALLNALALGCAAIGAVLAGVGAMLWALAPEAPPSAPWVLLVVPLLPLLAGVACVVAARAGSEREAMANLRQQFAADMLMLREAALA
jgi:F0F1-type ATP synthase assembly protein I